MKQYTHFFICTMVLFCSLATNAQNTSSKEKTGNASKSQEKAAYEMKQYFFVMLSKGENRTHDSATAANIQAGHMANMQKLADMGKLIVAGPFGDDGNWRGIFIMDCKTKEEAESLIKTDPAIVAGRLKYEIHPWWTAKNCVFK